MAIEFPQVEIPATTGPVVREVMETMHRYHRLFWTEFSDLTATQLDWRLSPDGDSIGMIWGHILLWQRIMVEGDLLRKPVDASAYRALTSDRWGRVRSEQPVDHYLSDMAELYQELMRFLAGLQDADLAMRIELVRPAGNRTVSLFERLSMILMHGFEHKGQMVLLTLHPDFPHA